MDTNYFALEKIIKENHLLMCVFEKSFLKCTFFVMIVINGKYHCRCTLVDTIKEER